MEDRSESVFGLSQRLLGILPALDRVWFGGGGYTTAGVLLYVLLFMKEVGARGFGCVLGCVGLDGGAAFGAASGLLGCFLGGVGGWVGCTVVLGRIGLVISVGWNWVGAQPYVLFAARSVPPS